MNGRVQPSEQPSETPFTTPEGNPSRWWTLAQDAALTAFGKARGLAWMKERRGVSGETLAEIGFEGERLLVDAEGRALLDVEAREVRPGDYLDVDTRLLKVINYYDEWSHAADRVARHITTEDEQLHVYMPNETVAIRRETR